MDERSFITEIRRIFQLPREPRFKAMSDFHQQVHADYCRAVSAIIPKRAEEASSDGRLVKQVVGHIMEWDRFTLISLGQLMSGVKTRKCLWKNGYVDKAGDPYNFGTIDGFNAFQAERQLSVPWPEIQGGAIGIATTLTNLLSKPAIVTPALLEDTEAISPELYDGQRFAIPCGWFLWYTILNHQAVEHARDIYATCD